MPKSAFGVDSGIHTVDLWVSLRSTQPTDHHNKHERNSYNEKIGILDNMYLCSRDVRRVQFKNHG